MPRSGFIGRDHRQTRLDRAPRNIPHGASRRRWGCAPGRRGSAPVFFRFGLSRGWMRLLIETMFNLVQDFDLILRLGIEVARVIPLEMRLEFASCTPIGIAEVGVDRGVGRREVSLP